MTEKLASYVVHRDNIIFTCRSVNNDRDYTIHGRVGSIGHLIMDIAFLLPDDEVFEWVGDDIRWSSDVDGVIKTYRRLRRHCIGMDGYDEFDQLEDFLGKIDRCFDNTFNCDYRIGGYVVCARVNDDEIDRFQTLDEAIECVDEFEISDQTDTNYTPEFYDIYTICRDGTKLYRSQNDF